MSMLQDFGYSLLIINIMLYLITCWHKKIGLLHLSSLQKRESLKINILLSILLLLLVNFIPIFHGVCLVAFLNGCFSDLSITFICILVYILSNKLINDSFYVKNVFSPPIIVVAISLLGLILYLSATGLIKYDIYALGYNNPYFLLGLAFISVVIFYFNRLFALVWLLALIAFYFKVQTSNNLWDYLFDPFLWLWCSILFVKKIKLRLKK